MATARKLPSGSWRVYQYIGIENGKRKYKSFTAETKKAAEYEAAEYMMQKRGKQAPEKMTIGESIDRYINSKTSVLSPSTIRGYRLDRRIRLQSIMNIFLDDLSQEQVQNAVNEDARDHSPKTVRNAHGLLSSALKEYYPDFNLRTKLPQRVKYEIVVPEDEGIAKLMAAARGKRIEVAIILSACVGLRRSEISALRLEDIDEAQKIIHVRRAMVLDDNKNWVVKGTKTYKSKRDIHVDQLIIDSLKCFQPINGYLVGLVPDTITNQFCAMRNELGLPYRLHDLRHYNASIMLALGVPDKYAMERMGHSTTSMLKNVYQHTMKDKTAEVSRTVNNHMSRFMHHEMHHEDEKQ